MSTCGWTVRPAGSPERNNKHAREAYGAPEDSEEPVDDHDRYQGDYTQDQEEPYNEAEEDSLAKDSPPRSSHDMPSLNRAQSPDTTSAVQSDRSGRTPDSITAYSSRVESAGQLPREARSPPRQSGCVSLLSAEPHTDGHSPATAREELDPGTKAGIGWSVEGGLASGGTEHIKRNPAERVSSRSNSVSSHKKAAICSEYLAGDCQLGYRCNLRHELPDNDDIEAMPSRTEDSSPGDDTANFAPVQPGRAWGQPQRSPSPSSRTPGGTTHARKPSQPNVREQSSSQDHPVPRSNNESWKPSSEAPKYKTDSIPFPAFYMSRNDTPSPPRHHGMSDETQPADEAYGAGNGDNGDDGWPAPKALSATWTAPIQAISYEEPKRPVYNAQQPSGRTGWQTSDAGPPPMASSSRSEITARRAAPSGWEAPVNTAPTSKSVIEVTSRRPVTENTAWTSDAPPPVPRVPSQYDDYGANADSNDGWPAPKKAIRGWDGDVGDYLSEDKARKPPASSIRASTSGWISGDLPSNVRISSNYASPTPASSSGRRGATPRAAPSTEVSNRSQPDARPRELPTNSQPDRRTPTSNNGWSAAAPDRSEYARQPAPISRSSGSNGQLPAASDRTIPSQPSGQSRISGFNEEVKASKPTQGNSPSRDSGWAARSPPYQSRSPAEAQKPLLSLNEYLAKEDARAQTGLTGAKLAQLGNGNRPPGISGRTTVVASGWSVPSDALHDTSIRPSESASNIGSRTDGSSSAAGQPAIYDSASKRPTRHWRPYAGDASSETSSGEGDSNGDRYARRPQEKLARPASGGASASSRERMASAQNGWKAPQAESSGANNWQAPQAQARSGWSTPRDGPPLPAPTPRQIDSHGYGVVNDLERAATPRAASRAREPEHQSGPAATNGRSISIIGAQKYHAEGLQLKDEVARLRKQVREYEAQLAARDEATKPARPRSLEDENKELRARLDKMEIERESLKAILMPILGILGLYGPQLSIQPVSSASDSRSGEPSGDSRAMQHSTPRASDGWGR